MMLARVANTHLNFSLCVMFVVCHLFALNAYTQEHSLPIGNATSSNGTYSAGIDDDGVQRVEILGGSYYFKPDHIIVKVNVPVELTFRKEPELTPHNIIIEAPGAGIDINEGMTIEPKTVTFTPSETGVFDISCDKRFLFFRNHREKGMEGVLEVVER